MSAGTSLRRAVQLRLRGQEIALGERTWIMGVLNVTPDSFSDAGRCLDPDTAVAHGLALFAAGADIVDVGGQSSRPGGAALVDAAEERRRVVGVIARLRARGLVSVDTWRASVAQAALDAGADLVNDISALRFDPELAQLLAARRAPAVLMHSRGTFETLHASPQYTDVMGEVVAELAAGLARAEAAGMPRTATIVDPGIGFAKNASHSLEVLRRLSELGALDRPVLVGPSRKSFIGQVLGAPVGERLMGTAAAVAVAIWGGAHLVRVHDVREMSDVARVADAILRSAANVPTGTGA